MAGWAPLLHLPVQACLPRSGVPRDSPHEGQSMWDSASITLGCAKRSLFCFIFSCQLTGCDSDEDADDLIEDEHHVTFACSGYVYARQLFPDLLSETTSTVGHFPSQPNPIGVANLLTWPWVSSTSMNRTSTRLNYLNRVNRA